jgi:hypothetical protein
MWAHTFLTEGATIFQATCDMVAETKLLCSPQTLDGGGWTLMLDVPSGGWVGADWCKLLPPSLAPGHPPEPRVACVV